MSGTALHCAPHPDDEAIGAPATLMALRDAAAMSASLAPELLFGFGSPADPRIEYAELLTEAVPRAGRWLLGGPRWLDAEAALAPPTEAEALVG